MTRAFVADASVAVGWVHPAQATPETAAMLDSIAEGAILEVPALWPLEVANALTVLVRRRKLSEKERQTALGVVARPPAAHRSRDVLIGVFPVVRAGQRVRSFRLRRGVPGTCRTSEPPSGLQ